MIKFLTAHTFEMEDPKAAEKEILEQLKPEQSLLKNSAGLVFCSLDFITSGVAERVCKALPFEVIGCTTQSIAVPGASGELMLAAGVLTSDDSRFAAGLSEPLDADIEDRLTGLYQSVSGALGSSPSQMIMIHPKLFNFPGDRTVKVFDRLSNGIPIFGTVALDEVLGSRSPMVIHNGSVYPDRIALLLTSGVESGFCSDFFYAPEVHFPGENKHVMRNRLGTGLSGNRLPGLDQPLLVTEARDNQLISVNNIPASEFMNRIGIVSKNQLDVISGFPILIDNHDGAGMRPNAIHGIEKGGVLRCGATITTGAALKLGSMVREDVLRSTEHLITSIKQENGRNGHLIFSCYGRSIVLVDLTDETAICRRQMEGRSYLFIYSGGEFCPVYDREGGVHNHFHQYSIVSASF
ncbi:MAG: FIST C-terminal domain-containing protein [Treponema sp.]|jgi:hypothetical protein|nr:FIST C-terminal domain-containing protein [Treponema sp.]